MFVFIPLLSPLIRLHHMSSYFFSFNECFCLFHLLSPSFILSKPLSSSFILFHPLYSSFILFHPLLSYFIPFYPISPSFIILNPLLSSFILFCPNSSGLILLYILHWIRKAVQLVYNPFIQFVSQAQIYSHLQLSLQSDPITSSWHPKERVVKLWAFSML